MHMHENIAHSDRNENVKEREKDFSCPPSSGGWKQGWAQGRNTNIDQSDKQQV